MSIGRAKWLELIQRRAAGARVCEIAEAMGVTSGAVSQTLSEPEVKAALEEIERDVIQSVKRRIVAATPKAFAAVLAVMEDEHTSAADKLKAATILFDRGDQRPGQILDTGLTVTLGTDAPATRLAALLARAAEAPEDADP